ncbi:hypothetical protein HMPREF1544_09713 [Mucor circinelloides 1006PhL]|uniref:Cell morphogenesis protein N-terminal domain-containing protein n=1 Tax=Mucor circinelloides f. circinelloides (strain 1006PhL) TaxID=1220926 RepID=S2J5R1_MUCC1|nr:hypothetical protein HMPREF1544_09713 [Mucor circinelloides 1006PhL]
MPYSTQQQSLDRGIPSSLNGTTNNNSNKAGSNANLTYDTPSQHSNTNQTTTSISSSDYALKVIFSQFEHMADAKMYIILNMGVDADVDLKRILGHGSDENFDKLIYSLSSLAATQQSGVIDAVMRWRKVKVEPLDPLLIKRVSDSAPLSRSREIQSVLKERQSLASVFILCRALIEIIKRLTPGSLPDDLGENLEEIVFNQLKKADPDAIKRSKNRTASMDLFAELIGELSNIRFASVSDRFIAELEKYNSQTIMKERQGHMEMLIKGMRYLKIKIYPVDALEETADFLSSCASFFKNAHGAKVKHAYAKLFIQLLLPIAEVAVAEVNFPSWAKAVDLMYPRAMKMTLKPRHVLAGYPLVTTLLCVSRKEFFAANWSSVLESCYQKFNKDKYTRLVTLGCVSRLTWTYLFRCTESTAITFKKMDLIIKTLFPPFRRAVNPADTPLDHLILIVYFSLMRDVDSGTKKILFYLLNTEASSASNSHNWDLINPERMIVALTAFRLMLADLENNVQQPPFPTDIDMAGCGISITCTADVFSGPIRAVKPEVTEKVEEIISKTLSSLDQTFGRLLVLDEKNIIMRAAQMTSSVNNSTITTNYSVPIFANTVGSSEGPQIHHQYASFSVSYTKDKQAYFDVIKTIIDGMPRIMPAGIQLRTLVDILSRYTVHTDPEIIKSASKALLRIAAQIDSQTVVVGFSHFICKIEDKFSDVIQSLASGPLIMTSSGGSSSSQMNGGVIKLYVDLLSIWIDQLDVASLDESKFSDLVRETEANGLLFLCNQSASIRKFAVQIIKMAARLADKLYQQALTCDEKEQAPYHLGQLLETVGQEVVQLDKDANTLRGHKLTSDVRNRVLQHQRRGLDHVLLQIAESDHTADIAIWNMCLPQVFKLCFERFPKVTAECRQVICTRLLQIQPSILAWVETMKAGATGTLSMAKSSTNNNKTASPETIEQWRIYLIFACATAVRVDSPTVSMPIWSHVGRKGSASIERISSPRDLFRLVLPYLTCEHRSIRESAIEGLGNINCNVYKSLMSELEGYVKIILDDGKQRNNQKPYQNKRSKKNDRLRISVMNVLELTAGCLADGEAVKDKELMNIIMGYIKETKSFLGDTEVQMEWEYQRLRIYLCGLVEKLYESLMQLEDATSCMSFETRLSLYKMFEEWCGYGATAKTSQQREATMMRDVLEQCKDPKERASMTQLMEEERKALEAASLSAMSTLLVSSCEVRKARQAIIQFDTLNVLRWIDAIFESRDPKYHAIARRSLEAVMIFNQDQTVLLDDIIEQCYAGNPKLEFTQGYFQALAEIVTQVEDYPCYIHQIMSLALFKSGDAKKAIRKTAINLLRVIEERVFADSCAKEYEIGITSSLPAIYKHTQTLLSARLALDHPEQTYSMLSEITQRFEHISPNSQREVLTYMLPWHRKVDLSVGPHDTELSASAYMVLSNLYYITVKFGDVYVKETAALWSQLVDYGRNVRAIIMYLLDMGQETRNPWFLIHAKRVFVCLGRTHAFATVTEEVIAEITPRSMVPQLKEASNRHAHAFPMLFVADTEKVLPSYPKRPVFSRGQLAMVFLVDLAIEAGADLAPHLPLLLHSIFVQLDHLTSIVCDQSRCFLINLIHSIVVRQSIDSEASQKASEIIQWLVSKEGKRLWAYENITPVNRRITSADEIKALLQQVVDVFSYEDRDLRQKWGETALKWATCCSVRHIACRSFQCFRALMPAFNQHMLADMLARLSNTIADKSEEIRGFALEIILTLTEVAKAMDKAQMEQFPQLFWAAVACLYSPYESEHCEALLLLDVVLQKNEFNPKLAESFPKNWSSEFDGLQPLLLKGLQFSSAEKETFHILDYVSLQDNLPLIDPTETRLMYLLLGSIPRLLHGLDGDAVDPDAVAWCNKLVKLFEDYGLPGIQRILTTYHLQKSKFQEDFLKQILGSMRDVFFTQYCQQAFMFSMLMVKNKDPHYRDKTLLLIENLVPYVTGKMVRTTTQVSIDIAVLEPLLQLVPTEYADRALSVLNSGIHAFTSNDDSNLTNDSELIWGFNNFAAAAKITRHNIHAVVFECSSITNEAPIEHNIQFSVEDFSMMTGEATSVAAAAAAATMGTERREEMRMSTMTDGIPIMSGGSPAAAVAYGDDLMNALKDLDDFFNEDGEPISPSSSSNLYMGVPNGDLSGSSGPTTPNNLNE